MKVLAGVLVGLLWIVAGVNAGKDFRNETIECVFREYHKCYRDIASLGANFSARYDETELQINATCRSESNTKQCISSVINTCNAFTGRVPVNRIIDQVHQLCNRNNTEHKKFLNSSICYNRNQNRRRRCVEKYSYGVKTDARSLCCSNMRTLRCLRDDMRNICSSNYTEFQNHLMETYRSHHSFLCGSHLQYCTGATSLAAAGLVLMLATLSILFQRV